jgi:hypothetical protein
MVCTKAYDLSACRTQHRVKPIIGAGYKDARSRDNIVLIYPACLVASLPSLKVRRHVPWYRGHVCLANDVTMLALKVPIHPAVTIFDEMGRMK